MAILAMALLFRLFDIGVPLIDGHSWRQVTNADIARHFAQTTWNLFTPQVSWGGTNGVVGMEFPLLHYIIGMIWRITGESEMLARVVTLIFSTASVWLIYLLGRDLFSVSTGRGAAFLLAIAPSTVFFGRSPLSDTPMVTFSIAAILMWHRWLTIPSHGRLAVATACTALAGLVKLPAVIIGLPIVALMWRHQQWSFLRNRAVWIGGITALAAIGGWYWYSDVIAARTGLTVAIFRPSGVYGPEIGLSSSAYEGVSHWSRLAVLLDPVFYREMVDRFWGLHLTPFGLAGAMIGWWMARGQRFAIVLDAWLAAGVIFLLATAEGQSRHEFHQLPLIPPLALYFGIAATPLFDGSRTRGLTRRTVGVSACLGLLAIMSFRASNVTLHLYRDQNLQAQFPVIGGELRSRTQADALFVTVDYKEGGTNSPMLLYYMHRQGWSFDVHAIDEHVVERLRSRFGARYFVTMQWAPLGEYKPDLIYYLARFQKIRLRTGSSQVRVFDLTQPLPADAR